MGKIYLGFWIPFVLPVPISNLAAGCFFFSFSSFGVLSLSARSCLLACTSVFVLPPHLSIIFSRLVTFPTLYIFDDWMGCLFLLYLLNDLTQCHILRNLLLGQ